MKIAIVTMVFKSEHIGGTEVASYYFAKYLAEKGHNVHVISSWQKGLPAESSEDGFFVHRLSYPGIPMVGIVILWLKVFWYLRHLDVDILHSQSVQMGLPCVAAKLFFKKPYVVLGQGSDIYLPWKFKKIISWLVFANAGGVMALTGDMQKEMQKIYTKEIIIVPSGIQLEDFQGLSKEAARSKYHLGLDKKVVLFVGELKTVKGARYALEALAMVKKQLPDITLVLVGDGPERKTLEAFSIKEGLTSMIMFAGKLPHEKIPEYMVAADLLVLPSLSEGFPLVVLEAMAAGLPIVASDVRGIGEIIKNGENGFLVEPKHPVQLAQKITDLLGDAPLREAISLRNKEKAKRYSWDLVVEKLIGAYADIIKPRV